jgi:hypothetical protein
MYVSMLDVLCPTDFLKLIFNCSPKKDIITSGVFVLFHQKFGQNSILSGSTFSTPAAPEPYAPSTTPEARPTIWQIKNNQFASGQAKAQSPHL